MGEFVTITPPAVGDPTELDSFADPILDNQNELIARVDGAGSISGIPNGSFELGSAADTAPSGWDLVIAAGNSTAFDTDTADTRHGRQSFSMTTPGSITGGVSLTSSAFLFCAEGLPLQISWLMKSSVATITNAVKVQWYDETEALISTDTLYSSSTANSTSWQENAFVATPPAGAKLYKIVVEGVNSTTAGTVHWDGFSLKLLLPMKAPEVFVTPGSTTYTTSPVAKKLKVTMKAGGGGGGEGATAGANGNAGGPGLKSWFNTSGQGTRDSGGGTGGFSDGSQSGGGVAQAGSYSAGLFRMGTGPGNYSQGEGSVAWTGGASQGSGFGQGGQGGPGTADAGGGGGGAEGEMAILWIDVTPNTIYDLVVGAGGAGGTGAAGSDGVAGIGGYVIVEEVPQ